MDNQFNTSKKYIDQVLRDKFRTSRNKNFNTRVIKLFCQKIGVKYGITVNSGTSGLHSALLSLDLNKDDEVLMPAITMSAVAYSIILSGAKPVFVDVDRKTLNLDLDDLQKKISNKTKALICVALFGLMPNYDSIKKIIKKSKKKIFIIEDNAECMIGRHGKKFAGNHGDFAMFSFQASKTISSGEGGIIVTNNKKLWNKAKLASNLGYKSRSLNYTKLRKKLTRTNFSRHVSLGFNYRLSELNAALVYGQLKQLKKILHKRKSNAEEFLKIIKKYQDIIFTQKIDKNITHAFWTVPIVFKNYANLKKFEKLWFRYRGDFYYGCWKIPYQEDFFKKLGISFNKCHIAESIQRRTIQLNTNYDKKSDLNKQLNVLDKVLQKLKT